MRRIIRFSFVILFLLIFYSVAWYVIAVNLCKNLGHYSSDLQIKLLGQNIKFTLQEIVPYGFPFRLGCKVKGLQEEGPDYFIKHNGVITIGYDLARVGLFFENIGQSIAQPKLKEENFGTKIDASCSYFFKLNSIAALRRAIAEGMKGISLFNLVNFIDWAQVMAKGVRAYDLLNEEMIFDHNFIKLSFNWDKSKYYSSLQELLNNIPQSCFLKLEADINHVSPGRRIIAPWSLLYLALPQFNKGHLDFGAKILSNKPNSTADDMLTNFTLQIFDLNFNSKDYSGVFKGNLDVKTIDKLEKGIFDFETNIKFTDLLWILEYIDKISKTLPELALLKKDSLASILNQAFAINSSGSGSYKIGPEISSTNFDHLSLMIEDVGFNLKFNAAVNSSKKWHYGGSVLLIKANKAVAQIVNMLSIYTQNKIYEQRKFVKTMLLLLKGISNHPGSNSSDVSIDFMISDDPNQSRIGTIPLKFFKNKDSLKKFFQQGN